MQIADPMRDMQPAARPGVKTLDVAFVAYWRKGRAEQWQPQLAAVRVAAKHQIPVVPAKQLLGVRIVIKHNSGRTGAGRHGRKEESGRQPPDQ